MIPLPVILFCLCSSQSFFYVLNQHIKPFFSLILQEKGFSVILSDMCPLVSGITTRDAALSAELGMRALDLAVGKAILSQSADCVKESAPSDDYNSSPGDNGILKPGGHLVIKLLESEDVKGDRRIH